MRVQGLDGRPYTLGLAGKVPALDDDRERSGPHLRARALLARLFPLDVRAEEVELPGTGGLRADFLLPQRRLVVEADGRQHREFSPFLHGSRLGMLACRRNDQLKEEWCERNGFRLVRLPDDRDDAEWAALLA